MLIDLTDLGGNIENRDKSKITNPYLFLSKGRHFTNLTD